MKRFNINDFIYIQITELGWEHLRKTVGDDYIKHCIESHREEINNEGWYRLQAHQVFYLLQGTGVRMLYSTNILIEDDSLKKYKFLKLRK